MEDGTKEDPAQKKVPKFLGKAGWLKKAPGRLLASYKDRYIHVEKTEVVVYEHEDLKNCIERVDLENYDKCLELKSPFKKKHRLILIRSQKAANKVHDAKFQAQSAEEKEAWIKALSDGICRAKNKVFDEVKVDESSNLEHVTRTRPKGNRNRRPPTRIHMKEVADVSSDGILRLDLDLEDAIMPNGATQTDSGETTQRLRVPSAEEDARSEPEDIPAKKVIKPPMPPTKEPKPSPAAQDETDKDEAPEKKVLKPPMPPSKEAKPSASPVEEAAEESQPEQVPEKSPDARKKAGPPPTPPNKPSTNSSTGNPAEASQPRPNSHPPTPPSKEKKPSQSAAEPHRQQEDSLETQSHDTEEALDGKRESPDVEDGGTEEESRETLSSNMKTESDKEPQIAADPPRKSPSPLPAARKKPDPQPDHLPSDTSTNCLRAEEPESEVPSIIVSLNDPLTDSLSLSPLLCPSSGEKKKKEEEKSVDSGQHSDVESEGSACEDTLAASTAALRGSHVGLDVLDTSEDDIRTAVILRPAPAANKPQAVGGRNLGPLRPSGKAKSASSGDLLSASADCARATQPGAPRGAVSSLESKVALEMEKTSDLLAQMGGDGEDTPEDLLAKAMEKLQRADHVLREVNKLQLKQNSHDRKSW